MNPSGRFRSFPPSPICRNLSPDPLGSAGIAAADIRRLRLVPESRRQRQIQLKRLFFRRPRPFISRVLCDADCVRSFRS